MVFKLFFKIVTDFLSKPHAESYVTYKTDKGEMV